MALTEVHSLLSHREVETATDSILSLKVAQAKTCRRDKIVEF